MATLNYIIKNGKDPLSIFARLRNGTSTDVSSKTGLFVNRNDWRIKQQEFKLRGDYPQNAKSNNELRNLKSFILDEFNVAQREGIDVTKTWLDGVIRIFFNRTSGEESDIEFYYIPYVEKFIEDAKTKKNPKTGKIRSNRTILDYKGTLKKLKHFEKVKGRKLRHTTINLKFHQEFITYCEEYHAITPKTIGGEIDNIKLFIKNAELSGYKVCNDYKKRLEFYSPDNKTHDIALEIEEINKIFNHNFSSNPKLNKARDWFIIGLWTGLRVGDLLELTKSDIKEDFIQIENKKTGIYVIIPLHEQVKKILSQNNGFPKKISSQNFNKYIKDIGKVVGLTQIVKGSKRVATTVKGYEDKPKKVFRNKVGNYKKYELISSHICRRSFSTYHYGKLDTLTIMSITGHKTERQFIDYVKIPPKKHAERMKELWRKLDALEKEEKEKEKTS